MIMLKKNSDIEECISSYKGFNNTINKSTGKTQRFNERTNC